MPCPECNDTKRSSSLPGFPCPKCDPQGYERARVLLIVAPPRTPSRYEAIEAEASFADMMKHRAVQAEKERDEARAERDALREAARALLTAALDECDAYGCQAVATRLLSGGDDAGVYCDACAEDLQAPCGGPEECDFSDLDHAPALRALRALLPPGVEKGSAT